MWEGGWNFHLPFPPLSFPFPSLLFHYLPSRPLLSILVYPLNSARGSRKRCKLREVQVSSQRTLIRARSTVYRTCDQCLTLMAHKISCLFDLCCFRWTVAMTSDSFIFHFRLTFIALLWTGSTSLPYFRVLFNTVLVFLSLCSIHHCSSSMCLQ